MWKINTILSNFSLSMSHSLLTTLKMIREKSSRVKAENFRECFTDNSVCCCSLTTFNDMYIKLHLRIYCLFLTNKKKCFLLRNLAK